MDLVKTLLVYMVMLVSAATDASPNVTPIPPNMIMTATPYVTAAPTLAPTTQATDTPTPTATPKPTSYATLFVGQKGTNVRKLQTRLRELGYLTDKADGVYGKNTKKAVEDFQRNNGIKVDGVAGKETQTILFESTAVVPAGETPTPEPTATATPAAAIRVPIYYLDTATNRLLYRTERLCYGRSTIYADASNVPSGYTLAGDASVVVTVSAGKASPATVIFQYDPPAKEFVTVKVYYRTYGGVSLNTSSELFEKGETRTVWVNDELIPYGYQLSGADSVNVSVSRTGYASPSSVTFYLSAVNTPTPTAVPAVSVPVNYQTTFGTRLATAYESLARGRSTDVYCDGRYIPDGYYLSSDSPVSVYVNSAGRATPQSVTFYLAREQTPTPVPTATPRSETVVNVYYVNEYNDLLYQTTARCLVNGTTDVPVDLSKVPSYQLLSEAVVSVYVDWYGNAQPQMVTFTFRERATPTPTVRPTDTPAPEQYVYVDVRYLSDQGSLIYQTSAPCRVFDTTNVSADFTYVPQNYELIGDSVVFVYVDEYGNASPDPVVFRFADRTPVIVTDPPVIVTDPPVVIVTDPPVPFSPLTERGALYVNGQDAGKWYDGESGNLMIDLTRVLDAAGIERTPQDDGYTAVVGASELTARYTYDAVNEVAVDGRTPQDALMLNGTLYVSLDLLTFAGATFELNGDTLTINL